MSNLIINGINVNKNKTEEFYSSVIAAILNYSDQNYSVFKSFLKLADKVSDNSFPVFSNLPVHSPIIEAEKYEVDVLINDNNYGIVIENKINNAKDGPRQLARYIDARVNGAHYFEKDVYVIYITDDKKDPHEQSWIRLENRLIATDFKDDFKERYVNITRADICNWIEGDVIDLCLDNPDMYSFVSTSLKLFKREINQNDFKNRIANINSNKIENCSGNERIDFKEALTHWREAIDHLYSKDVISHIKVENNHIEIIFSWSSKEHNYKLGCRMEFYRRMEKYEKTFFRYGIHKVDGDIPCFSKEFLTNLFTLFFKIDRYYDRYRYYQKFDYRKEHDSYYYYVSREVQLWSCSDYEFQFVLRYYLLDLIDKIIMFIIAPSQLGLLNPEGNLSD